MIKNCLSMKANSLKITPKSCIFFMLLLLIGGAASQDCFRFYRIDTFEVWRIPHGSGLCNLDSWTNCTNNGVALITNSSTSLFQFYVCGSDLTNPSDMTESYVTDSDKTILVNFYANGSSSLKPFNFVEGTNSSASDLYKITVQTNDSGFGKSPSSISILKGDIVVENQNAKVIMQAIMVIVFLAVISGLFAKPALRSAVSVGYCIFYWLIVCATYLIEFSSILRVIIGLTVIFLISGGVTYTVYLFSQRNPVAISSLSICISLFFLIGLIFIPGDGLIKGLVVATAVIIISIASVQLCCVGQMANQSSLNLLKFRLAESSIFSTVLFGASMFCFSLSITYTGKRYENLSNTYPADQGASRALGYLFLGLIEICIFSGIASVVNNIICSELRHQATVDFSTHPADATYHVASPTHYI